MGANDQDRSGCSDWLRLCGCRLVVACFLTVCCGPVVPAASHAQESVRFSRLSSEHGLRRYVPHRWGVVGMDVVNPTDKPIEVLSAVSLDIEPNAQFSRKLWVPPHAIRRSWTPLKVPNVPQRVQQMYCASMLFDQSTGRDVALRLAGEGVQHRTVLRVDRGPWVTGIISPEYEAKSFSGIDYAYEAVIGLRTSAGLDRRLVIIADRYLPALPEALDGLDQLVLYNDRYAEDVAAMAAIRAWLHNGGRIWIMLDRVDFEGVGRLLGAAFTCELIDHVELSDVEIASVMPRRLKGYTPSRHFEQPVRMARLVLTDIEVTHTVNGWPAAFSQRVGRGKVVFTTVGAEAWIDRFHRSSGEWDAYHMTDFEPTIQLSELSILEPRERVQMRSATALPYLSEQIGYRIPSRRLVLGVLLSFCGLLLAASLWLARGRRLEHLGWIAPIAALGAAVPLVWLGGSAKHAVPPTNGQLQLIEVSATGDRATATGSLAIYQPNGSDESIGARSGGVVDLAIAGQQSNLRRMVWQDLDHWQSQQCQLPAGLHVLPFQRSMDFPQPVRASGAFDESGLRIQLTGLRDLQDVVLACPGQPRMAVHGQDREYRTAADAILARDQYLAADWLNDEQRRRQAVYRTLLDNAKRPTRWGTQPLLLGWLEPRDMDFDLPGSSRQVGSSLWALPLSLVRPPENTRIAIPSPLVSYQAVPEPGSLGASPLYDRRKGEWVQANGAGRVWLRFSLPAEVLPIEIEEVRLTIQLAAPDRTLQIVRATPDGGHEVMFEHSDPLGKYEWNLAQPERLADGEGRLLLGILVGEMSRTPKRGKASRWKIERLQLAVGGRVH